MVIRNKSTYHCQLTASGRKANIPSEFQQELRWDVALSIVALVVLQIGHDIIRWFIALLGHTRIVLGAAAGG